MDYELVRIEEKTVEGIEIRTENKDGKAMRDIFPLWKDFLGNGKGEMIHGRVNTNYIGLYTDYEGDFTKPYSYIAGCETDGSTAPVFTAKKIRAGNYAKFVTKNPEKGLGEIWNAVWALPLKRAYASDFEEYFPGQDGQPEEIHVYIGVEE
ncbi:GyrI-like domain-containing protein [Christensenella intestinihominis]|uniref:GyrI-like domain-containing protein n=1 Tax=Christensenella intestinihominis TaxID=1851429 RepID=UPI00083001D4|nr:effector binding domain-containing protein [Christensenella intestinihominis]